jgi:hypothetical protein
MKEPATLKAVRTLERQAKALALALSHEAGACTRDLQRAVAGALATRRELISGRRWTAFACALSEVTLQGAACVCRRLHAREEDLHSAMARALAERKRWAQIARGLERRYLST